MVSFILNNYFREKQMPIKIRIRKRLIPKRNQP
jgi:hypothetical protein